MTDEAVAENRHVCNQEQHSIIPGAGLDDPWVPVQLRII